MNWKDLNQLSQIDELIEESKNAPILIFKHSRSCSISRTSLDRLERNWNLDDEVKSYFLDLLSYRELSNAIAEKLKVRHESPQVLIVHDGKTLYSQSHFDINFNDIKNQLTKNNTAMPVMGSQKNKGN